jgi:hypothetical protein
MMLVATVSHTSVTVTGDWQVPVRCCMPHHTSAMWIPSCGSHRNSLRFATIHRFSLILTARCLHRLCHLTSHPLFSVFTFRLAQENSLEDSEMIMIYLVLVCRHCHLHLSLFTDSIEPGAIQDVLIDREVPNHKFFSGAFSNWPGQVRAMVHVAWCVPDAPVSTNSIHAVLYDVEIWLRNTAGLGLTKRIKTVRFSLSTTHTPLR